MGIWRNGHEKINDWIDESNESIKRICTYALAHKEYSRYALQVLEVNGSPEAIESIGTLGKKYQECAERAIEALKKSGGAENADVIADIGIAHDTYAFDAITALQDVRNETALAKMGEHYKHEKRTGPAVLKALGALDTDRAAGMIVLLVRSNGFGTLATAGVETLQKMSVSGATRNLAEIACSYKDVAVEAIKGLRKKDPMHAVLGIVAVCQKYKDSIEVLTEGTNALLAIRYERGADNQPEAVDASLKSIAEIIGGSPVQLVSLLQNNPLPDINKLREAFNGLQKTGLFGPGDSLTGIFSAAETLKALKFPDVVLSSGAILANN